MTLAAYHLHFNFADALRFAESDKGQITKESTEKNTMTFCLHEVNPIGFESHAVVAKGSGGLNKEVLLYYFESKSASQGGPVLECDFRDKNTFYVVFQNAEGRVRRAHSDISQKKISF